MGSPPPIPNVLQQIALVVTWTVTAVRLTVTAFPQFVDV